MMRKLLVLTLTAGALLSAVPSNADTVECHLQGNAGEFAVRKIVNPWFNNIDFGIARTWPNQLEVSDDENYHLFTGFWLLRASDFSGMAHAFFDHSTNLNPAGVNISYQGMQPIDVSTPSSNLLVDGDQGAYGYTSRLWPGTYYFVGFADGDGTFDITLAADTFGGAISCEPMPEVTGRVVGFNALDFKGGTQVVAPGYGYAENAKLSFTNPYPWTIGAVFAYQPAPFPKPTLLLENEGGYREDFSGKMKSVLNTSRDWSFTAGYQGKTNTMLIELLQTNLAPTG